MGFQEPVTVAIWNALNHYCYSDAIFLAERLYAEVDSDEALFLLATSYYRSGKPNRAYTLLDQKGCPTPQCRYLMAQCCLESNKLGEAEAMLSGNTLTKQKTPDDLVAEYGDSASYALKLLGKIYSKTERNAKGAEQFKKSLKLNPFLWSSFESLCHIGERPDATKIFQPSSCTNFSSLCHPAINTSSSSPSPTPLESQPQITVTPAQPIPQLIIKENQSRDFTPDSIGPASPPLRRRLRTHLQQATPSALSPHTPSFGVMPLEVTPSPGNSNNFITPPSIMFDDNLVLMAPRRTRKAKENVKKAQPQKKFTSPKAPTKKTKTRSCRTAQELNEINKAESVDVKQMANTPQPPSVFTLQKKSAEGLMQLLQELGKAYASLCQYECATALKLFSSLPAHHYHTGWVLCQVGRAYFEMAQYQKAEKMFSTVRQLEPHHLEGMETYSTTLWHLQREVQLSALANDLVKLDNQSPEAWCATGNCFSLQKENDVAIKFFQRAIQVAPNFAYAYTLLGHEYVSTEELDKALACFRNAIRVDPRHYNAWYGVGMIYNKQEKFALAEVHYRKALSINPQSPTLLCHLGVVQHALRKSESALATLDRAISADPKNPLCKFHRASILFATDKPKEALSELEELKQIAPKESLVYFLIGKVHKKLGNTHLALMNFSWAMDLDPKGANNQIKEAIDKRYVTDDDDPTQGIDESGALEAASSNNSSLMEADDVQLQAIESDESL